MNVLFDSVLRAEVRKILMVSGRGTGRMALLGLLAFEPMSPTLRDTNILYNILCEVIVCEENMFG